MTEEQVTRLTRKFLKQARSQGWTKADNGLYDVLFDINFAKAIWGTGKHWARKPAIADDWICRNCHAKSAPYCAADTNLQTCYQYHLQHLVLAENKFEYLVGHCPFDL